MTFKVPFSTLQQPKDAGGTALIHIMAKCTNLFIVRMERQGQQTDNFTADWLTKWHLHGRTPNPPDIRRIPTKLDYLYRYNIQAAYTPIRGNLESQKIYRKLLYKGLLTSIHAVAGLHEMRIQKLWPDTDWIQVWKNLSDAPVSDNTQCVWYQFIHDLIPTNVRLHRINVTPSNTCQQCAAIDTLEHRLNVCGEGRLIWQYMKTILARMLRTIPARTSNEWLLRPHFNIWPSKRNHAVLWTLANVVISRLLQRTAPKLQDFMYFLFRSRCKLMNNRLGRDLVGNYLTVLDPTPTGR